MATEWAGRYQSRPCDAKDSHGAAQSTAEQLAAWLAAERLVGGRAVPHWVICLLCCCVLGAGPSSLGWLLLALALYKIYALHQGGHTAASLWEEFSQKVASADAASAAKKRRRR